MALTLIGTGVSFDLTQSALDPLTSSDRIYWEAYTGIISEEKIHELAQTLGKEIIRLERNQIESSFLINEARNANIALLVAGDPLTATTHVALLMEAKKAHIATRVVPNSSIYTVAPGKAGLQIYRFGKTVSLVHPSPNYQPTSALDGIKQNQDQNLHTLILLDTEPQPMDAKTALAILESAGYSAKKIVVLSRLGHPDEKIRYGLSAVLKTRDLGQPPFCLILPAKLHFLEKEYLQLFLVE